MIELDKHRLVSLTSARDLSGSPEFGGRTRTLTRVHPLARLLCPETIGGKAYSLYRMSSMGFRVPVACVMPIWTWSVHSVMEGKGKQVKFLHDCIQSVQYHMEADWNIPNVSVLEMKIAIRSGSSVSMPGMMDTILGINPRKTDQVLEAVDRVFRSFKSKRCVAYRKKHSLEEIGTAVVFQGQVEPGGEGGAGVAYSIDPVTGGGWGLFGEVLFGQGGEKLVSGRITPSPIEAMKKHYSSIYDELFAGVTVLENEWSGPVEVEFVWDNKILHWLQCRSVRVSKVKEWGTKSGNLLGRGYPASRGTMTGFVYGPGAIGEGDHVGSRVWVAPMTTPEDYPFMEMSQGIVTLIGGVTSHAAVVSRELGIPCVVAYQGKPLKLGSKVHVDGHTGEVFGE